MSSVKGLECNLMRWFRKRCIEFMEVYTGGKQRIH